MATITGTPQSDRLNGTAGDDTIIGLAGHDISTGGDGGDRFVYQRLSDLSAWTGSVLPWHETITDLGEHGDVVEGEERDVLDFSALSNFLFIGDDEFSATGRNEYRFERLGEGAVILFDQGGDGAADRYLVLDTVSPVFSFNSFEDLDQHPIFTNLLHYDDFSAHYEVGTAANETMAGTADSDRMYGLGGNDRMNGGAGDDEMFGGAGNDRLDGGAGIDWLIGGAGNDTYVVESSTEHEEIVEEADGGIDHVFSSGFFNPMPFGVENMTLFDEGASSLPTYEAAGNGFSNIITGSSANNRIGGGAGNDTLMGGAGGDSIRGGTGHDWIRGGTGADYLLGNSGADKFVYYSVAEAGFASDGTGDFIRDFESFNSGATEPDRIDLHRIDANTATAADDAFHFMTGEFTGTAGELHAAFGFVEVVDPDPYFPDESFQANIWLVEGDVDGDAAADFQIGVIQPQFSQFSAGDFFL
jgi:Ca2+-binding RTX toxin-like protein